MMDPPMIRQNSEGAQDPPMDIKMECDDVTEEEDYFSTVTTETTDDATDSDIKNEATLPIKMAPPVESLTLEDFVNQETAQQKNPIIANQLQGPTLHQQLEISEKQDGPEIGMPQVDRTVPLSMSLPVTLPPGPGIDPTLSDSGMTSDTSVLTKVDAPQTKNTLLKQIIDKACLKLAREGEESLFLSVNIEKKLCSFVGTETGRQFLTKRPDIMEHFFQFCQAVYKARGDLVTTEGTSSTEDDPDIPSSPKKSKPDSPRITTPENKTEVSKTTAGHPMTRSQSKGGKSQTVQSVQENKKVPGRVQSSRPCRKKRGQHNVGKEKAVKVEPSIEIVTESQSDLEMECEGPLDESKKSDPLNDPDILKLSKDLDNTDASWDKHLQNMGSGKLMVFNVTSKVLDSSIKEAKKEDKVRENGSEEPNVKSPKPDVDIKKQAPAALPCSMPCFPMFEKCASSASLANCKIINVDGNKEGVSSDPNSPNKTKNYEILTDLLDNQNPNMVSPYILSVPTLQNANAPIVKQEASVSTYKSPSRRRNKDGKKPKMCHRYSREERDEIAEYAIKHGLTKSADHFNKLWNMKLTPSTIFYFRKTYLRDKKNEESLKDEDCESKGSNYLTSNGIPQSMYSYEKKTARKSISSPNRRKPRTKLDEAEKVLQEMELKQKILKICSMEKKNADIDSSGNSPALKENSDTGQHLLNNVDINQGGNFLVYNAESMESVWSGEEAARQNFALEMGFPNNHILQPKYCLLPSQKDTDSLVLQKPTNNTDQLGEDNSDFTTRRDEEIIIEGLKDPDITHSLPNTKHQNGTTETSPKSEGKTTRVSRRKNTPRKALATSFPIEIKEFTKEEEIEIAKYAMDHSLQDTATFFQILWNVHLDTDTVKVFKDNYLQGSQVERGIGDDDPDSCFTYVL